MALATAPWYDAVVLGEPAHREVVAQPRRVEQQRQPGTRAYLAAGLPGAEWWVAGAVMARGEDADVELDEVERFLQRARPLESPL